MVGAYPKKLTIDTYITNILIDSKFFVIRDNKELANITTEHLFSHPILNRIYKVKDGMNEILYQHCIKYVTLKSFKL